MLCDPTTLSGAWIDPTGVVIDLDAIRRERGGISFDHEEAAQELLGLSPEDEALQTTDAVDTLIAAGWIRVSNAISIDCDESVTTDVAQRAFVSMLVKCVVDKHLNPEDRIFVGLQGANWQPTIDELVNDWGGKKMSEEMYAKLLGESAYHALRNIIRHHLRD